MRFETIPLGKQKKWLATGLALTALFGGFLTGCGSGGNNTPNPSPTPSTIDAAGAAADVTRGQGQLSTLITAQVDPTSASLDTMTQSFASAYAKDSNNTQAAMGLAIGGIAKSVQNVVNVATSTSRAAASAGHPLSRAQQADISSLTQTAQSALPWKMQRFDGKTGLKTVQGALILPVTLSRLGRSGGRAADVAAIRQSLVDLKTALDKAMPLVQQAANQNTFGFVFPDFETNTGSVRVMDQADATSFLASLYAVRGVLNIALAYDPTYNGFDFSQSIGSRFAAKNAGDRITPDEYLPAAPFLNLTGTGKAGFAQAQTDFATGADNANTALDRLRNRTTSALHLIDTDQLTNLDFVVAHDGVNQFKNALFNPYTTTDSKHTVVNLAAWFNNPPASLRALLPTYTINNDVNGGFLYIAADASAFPDLSFGGLIGNADRTSFNQQFYGDQTIGDLATYSGYANY